MYSAKDKSFARPFQRNLDDSTSISSNSALSRQESYSAFSQRQLQNATPPPPPPPAASLFGDDTNRSLNASVRSSQTLTSKKGSANNGNNVVAIPGQLSSAKAGRVKVGIRCRPAFQDEIDFAQGNYMSIVDTKPENPDNNMLGLVSLTLMSGKLREFQYDYVFGSRESQDSVYDRIARPVVTDVLRGFNGTIFAYGQTGTGKTYTMGILECVNSDHAGIIPRAISQIFEHVDTQSSINDITISLSFLQLYRETIQDLLAPVNGASVVEDNLAIREDPSRGFYVEGLQEFVVRSYNEAEALLNLGLENRAIAPTLMNSTSSRSHTVLTLHIEQHNTGGLDDPGFDASIGPVTTGKKTSRLGSSTGYSRIVRSKLLMVDLAGSERVRRTVSKGTRLSEAKSINTSLSALGNVIAALADPHIGHVPYRDSKLTRLLQDSLGGTASTALIATIGPAAINYGETLSTLMFATRCMAVKTTPVQHEEIDYAELCTRLQEKLSTVESEYTEKMLQQQDRYESIIRDLNVQLTLARSGGNMIVPSGDNSHIGNISESAGYTNLISELQAIRSQAGTDGHPATTTATATGRSKDSLGGWLNADPATHGIGSGDDELLALLGFCYQVLSGVATDSVLTLEANMDRELAYKRDLVEQFAEETKLEGVRESERESLEFEDPLLQHNANKKKVKAIGSHLAPLTKLEALNRVEGHYRSNNDPLSEWDQSQLQLATGSFKPKLSDYQGPQELAEALANMHSVIQQNMTSAAIFMARKDEHYRMVKGELADHLMEKRKREEEVLNWSFILKYLLSSSSKLRKQLQSEKKAAQVAINHSINAAYSREVDRDTDNLGSGAANNSSAVHRNNVPFDQNNKLQSSHQQPPPIPRSSSSNPTNNRTTTVNAAAGKPRPGGIVGEETHNEDDIDDLISEIAAGANAVKGLESIISGSETGSRSGNVSISASASASHRSLGNPTVSKSKFGGNSNTAQSYPLQGAQDSPYLDQVRIRNEQQKVQQAEDQRLLLEQSMNSSSLLSSGMKFGPRTSKFHQMGIQHDDSEANRDHVHHQNLSHSHHPYTDAIPARSEQQSSYNPPLRKPFVDAGEEPYSYSDDEIDRRSMDDTSDITFTNATLQSETSPMSQHHQHQQLQHRDRDYMRESFQGIGRPKYLDPVSSYHPQPTQFSKPINARRNNNQNNSNSSNNNNGINNINSISSHDTPVATHNPSHSTDKRNAGSNRGSVSTSVNSTGQPSSFAKQIVDGLGVDKSQEAAALSIVDRVTKITNKQLNLLDPETRAQVIQIRQELGLEALPPPTYSNSPQSGSGLSASNSNSSSKQRSASAPKQRVSGTSINSAQGTPSLASTASSRRYAADDNYQTPQVGTSFGNPNFGNSNNNNNNRNNSANNSSINNQRRNIPVVEVNLMANGFNSRPSSNDGAPGNPQRMVGNHAIAAEVSTSDEEKARAKAMAEARRLQRNGDARYLIGSKEEELQASYQPYPAHTQRTQTMQPQQQHQHLANRYSSSGGVQQSTSRASHRYSTGTAIDPRQQQTGGSYYDNNEYQDDDEEDSDNDDDGYSQLDDLDMH